MQAMAKRNSIAMAKLGAESGDSFAKSFTDKMSDGIGLGTGLAVGPALPGDGSPRSRPGPARSRSTLNATMETTARSMKRPGKSTAAKSSIRKRTLPGMAASRRLNGYV
jgi:hypothetical protein